jgi:hypothetical protein
MTSSNYRMIGSTDDVVECAKCGRVDLKMTVILELLDADGQPEGDPTYFGTTCAARALATRGVRVTAAKLADQARAADKHRKDQKRHALEMLTFYGLPVEPVDADRENLIPARIRYFEQNPSAVGRYSFSERVAEWRAMAR